MARVVVVGGGIGGLLEPPWSYWGNPDIEVRVEEVRRSMDGSAPAPAPPGPDHATMATLLGAISC